jgi:hypothetical protein
MSISVACGGGPYEPTSTVPYTWRCGRAVGAGWLKMTIVFSTARRPQRLTVLPFGDFSGGRFALCWSILCCHCPEPRSLVSHVFPHVRGPRAHGGVGMAFAQGSWQSRPLGSTKAVVGKEANVPWTSSGLAMQTAMMSIGPVQKQRTSVAWRLAIASHLDSASAPSPIAGGQSLSTVIVPL